MGRLIKDEDATADGKGRSMRLLMARSGVLGSRSDQSRESGVLGQPSWLGSAGAASVRISGRPLWEV